MKTYMPLDGFRWSCDSDSALCDIPQTNVLGQAGGGLYFDSIMLYLSPSRLNILGFLVKSKKVSFHTTLSFLFRVYWVK